MVGVVCRCDKDLSRHKYGTGQRIKEVFKGDKIVKLFKHPVQGEEQ